jgi:hypothetical protein
MAAVTKHIVVRLEMTVPEARILLASLVELPVDDPTDPIWRALKESLDGLEEDAS